MPSATRTRAPSRPPRRRVARGSDEAPAEAFARLLESTKREVERRMRKLFDARLRARASLGPEVRVVLEAARDLSLRGGKRFRAALVVLAYRGTAPGAPPAPAMAAGVALELLQSYLLVQDDWMDGDVERRGGPSAHVSIASALGRRPHDAAVGAVLASDLLWGLALGELLASGASAHGVLAATRELARFHDDVVTGQVLDSLAQAPDIERLHALKTGSYTVEGPLCLGAALAGADPRSLRALRRFAAPLGVAFQLRDDLLGVFGTEAESGRPVGSDLRAGKRTSVIAHALASLPEADRERLEALLGKRNPRAAELAWAQRTIEASGARREVERRLGRLCNEAERRARTLPLGERARAELVGAVAAVRRIPGATTRAA